MFTVRRLFVSGAIKQLRGSFRNRIAFSNLIDYFLRADDGHDSAEVSG